MPSRKTELPPPQRSFSTVGFSGFTQWDITPASPTSLGPIVSTTSSDFMNRGSILQPRTAQLPRLDSGPLPSESISAPSTQSSTSTPGPSSTYRSLQGPESSTISVPLAGPVPSSLSGPTTPSAVQSRRVERCSKGQGSVQQLSTAQLPGLVSGPLAIMPPESMLAPSGLWPISVTGSSSTSEPIQGPGPSSGSVSLARPSPSAGESRLGKRHSEEALADNQGTPAKTAKEVSFKCEFCPAIYTNERILRNHLNNVHPVKKCRLCNFLTRREEELNAHIAQQHPVLLTNSPDAFARKWKCSEPSCTSSFHTRLDLFKHKATHFIYECRGCTTKYRKKQQLDNHNQIFHHSNEEICLRCHHCGNHFQGLKKFKEHVEDVIKNEDQTQCPVCGVDYMTRSALEEHYYQSGDVHYDNIEFKKRPDKDDDNDGGGGGGSSNVLQVNYVFTHHVYEPLNLKKIKKSRMIEFFICKKCKKAFETKWWLRKHCLYFCEATSHTCL